MLKLPGKMEEHLHRTTYTMDSVGMSGASIYFFADMVLKIEKECEESEHEFIMLEWLKDRLPVPGVICREKQDGMNYLLMSRLRGKMLCDKLYLSNSEAVLDILSEGLRMLWQVDLSDCPHQYGLDRKLRMAQYNVEHGLVDVENTEPDTFGKDGFKNPEELLKWLIQNRPEEDPVFSHGDFCLPNIFAENGRISGFLDLGKTGIADRYQDIALCYRSLQHNCEGKYGGGIYDKVDPDILFDKLNIDPDWDKIKYYLLLDELF